MKTAMHQLAEELRKREERQKGNDLALAYSYAAELAEDLLEIEKQQHEKTAICMVNICLSNLDYPNCKIEDEFYKYWDINSEKQTLK